MDNENVDKEGRVSRSVSSDLLAVGSMVNRNGIKGKILAVGWVGERYYWLDCDGVVSMIPATAIDG
jgi:hypothetical protein